MRRIAVLLFVLAAALPLTAAFRKPYFANTTPGTWAKYDVRDTHNKNAYSMTYRRLADDGDLLGVEIQADFPASSPGGPMSSITRYAVASTFGWDRNAITFPRYAKSIVAGIAGGELTPLPPQAIEMVTKEVTDYGASSTFKATETVGGKQVDRYTYSFTAPSGSNESGELWLSDQVPFGIVKQTATMKDAEGKIVATMEYTLADSGKGKADEE
jgi:hypothetical protein